MSARKPQVVDPQEFIPILDYQFSGDVSTVERKRQFLEAYREEGVIYRAANRVGIHRTTVYKWMDSDDTFALAFGHYHDDTYDELEASGFKKALAGDPILTMFYLKAHRPKFRDKTTVDINLVDDEIRERMATLDMRQLPPMTTTFVDSGNHTSPAFPSPEPAITKRES